MIESMIDSFPTVPLPPLQSGDRLPREEFERRYHLMPENLKAELIEGVVYMPSPVPAQSHARPHGLIMGWLAVYAAATPGVDLLDNATVRLDTQNEVQPDALLRIATPLGGHSWISEDDYVEGVPELIVEIAASSAAYDLHDKLEVYRRNGVEEYIVWTMFPRRLDWFRLVDDNYVPLSVDDDGVIRSIIFHGLRLDVAATLAEDLSKVLAVLHTGIQAPEHAAFVERLSHCAS